MVCPKGALYHGAVTVPKPPDDEARVAAVLDYRVVGAPPLPDLPSIVELAAFLLGVPNAVVNIITADEQHQIAAYGFEARLRTDVEGSGIGLATCQRIVEAHGAALVIGETPAAARCASPCRVPLGRTTRRVDGVHRCPIVLRCSTVADERRSIAAPGHLAVPAATLTGQ